MIGISLLLPRERKGRETKKNGIPATNLLIHNATPDLLLFGYVPLTRGKGLHFNKSSLALGMGLWERSEWETRNSLQ